MSTCSVVLCDPLGKLSAACMSSSSTIKIRRFLTHSYICARASIIEFNRPLLCAVRTSLAAPMKNEVNGEKSERKSIEIVCMPLAHFFERKKIFGSRNNNQIKIELLGCQSKSGKSISSQSEWESMLESGSLPRKRIHSELSANSTSLPHCCSRIINQAFNLLWCLGIEL